MASPSESHTRTRRAVLLHSRQMEQHPYPPECPFKSSRAGAARKIIASMGLLGGARREVAPRPATRDELLTFHTARYLDALQQAPSGALGAAMFEMGLGTPDCPVFKGMYEYAALAAGASLQAADLLEAGEADVAFNPSGGYHHAGPAKAAGFCYINDVVLAALRLAGAGRRVAVLDIDAHHGDGTQNAFYDRADVLTISLHESPDTLFPGTGFAEEIGVGAGRGYCANVPLPPEVHDAAFLRALREVALPLLRWYGPDVIVLEIGMDGLAGDPLTHMSLTNNAYAEAIEAAGAFERPLLATGGGGYHERNTARGWAMAWSVLCGADADAAEQSLGLGGVLLESTDWLGGLRDRRRAPSAEHKQAVDAAVDQSIAAVKKHVFAVHGL